MRGKFLGLIGALGVISLATACASSVVGTATADLDGLTAADSVPTSVVVTDSTNADPAPEASADQNPPLDFTPGSSTATVDDDGIIIVSTNDSDLVIDLYEDALCPICGNFEQHYGEKVTQAIESGSLTVRYRMVSFLDSYSASGDYSTRAFGAMLVLAAESGDIPGLFEAYHRTLFDPSTQPAEKGTSDWSDQDLADIARTLGAPATTAEKIAAGSARSQAAAAAEANLTELSAVSPRPGTPSIVHNDAVVERGPGWLTSLLGS